MNDEVLADLDSLCAAAQEYGASDLLFHEGEVPRVRLQGRLVELDHAALNAEFFEVLRSVCGAQPQDLDFDGSLMSQGGVRFRVNLMKQLGRHAAVLRRIRRDLPNLENLGLPSGLLQNWCSRPSGIVLVCGPTGSGKSTTLAAAMQWLNDNTVSHIVTIEDPVEYLFTNNKSVFTQREVGVDTASFAEGLRRALRQNPDVILVGEIRDSLTATTAIQASETGHLVLATLHSASCSEAMERLQLLFSAGDRESVRKSLSAQLVGMLCQRLIPGTNGNLVLVTEYFSNIASTREHISRDSRAELADYLAQSNTTEAIDFIGSLVAMVKGGKISEAEAMAAADRPQELQRALRGISSRLTRA